ncbi:hypothetical protein D3C80_895410 [compost metagenome]
MPKDRKNDHHGHKQQQVVQEARADHDHWQGDARKAHLFHEVALIDEHGQATPHDFGKEVPGQYACDQVQRISVLVIDPWQPRAQYIRQDQRIDSNLRQRMDDHPQATQLATREP